MKLGSCTVTSWLSIVLVFQGCYRADLSTCGTTQTVRLYDIFSDLTTTNLLVTQQKSQVSLVWFANIKEAWVTQFFKIQNKWCQGSTPLEAIPLARKTITSNEM